MTTMPYAALRQLAAALDGDLLLPDDPGFPATRRPTIYGLRETLPAAVAQCVSAGDVIRAVTFVRDHELPFAIRGGGHSFADFSCTPGLLIDLRRMDGIAVSGETVTIGPGVRVQPLAERLAEVDRLVPSGWCPTVGVIGALLGGGFGRFSRHFGLGCDHLLAADVVLADGRRVRVDAERHPDLFWALRGAGGGNFGVVTSAVLRTRPVPPTTAFAHLWTFEHAARVVDCWQRRAPFADSTINAELVLMMGPMPDSLAALFLFGVVVGPAARAEEFIADLAREVGDPGRSRGVRELSAPEAARESSYAGMPTPAEPHVLAPGQRPERRVTRSGFFDRPLPTEAIEELVRSFVADRVPGQYREVEFVPWGGAYRQTPPGGTAFAHRDPLFLMETTVMVGSDAADDARVAAAEWATRNFHTVRPWTTGAVYPNYPERELTDWGTAYYGANFTRLQEIKARYDPTNLFRFAQSIPLPAGGVADRQPARLVTPDDGGPDQVAPLGPGAVVVTHPGVAEQVP
jgi:FAD/FMN-containing dehydrogenase